MGKSEKSRLKNVDEFRVELAQEFFVELTRLTDFAICTNGVKNLILQCKQLLNLFQLQNKDVK